MSSVSPLRSDNFNPSREAVLRRASQDAAAVDLGAMNARFATLSAEERVREALRDLPGAHVLSSSFGAQAAVSLHMLTRAEPDLPVVLIDTGYLFPETYQFVETLTEQLDLNLKVYRAAMSPARQEALFGERWNQGLEGLEAYNRQNKVEPMRRALEALDTGTWFTGLRRDQASTRSSTPFVAQSGGRFKVAPIADWNDRDVYRYLTEHKLPYHPLWEQGYVSIGDTHSTIPLHQADSLEATRFDGLKRECGLHDGTL
ncbi:MAG: phosphoadenylyl-sulfate reductase [Pseudomonadota bacterium]